MSDLAFGTVTLPKAIAKYIFSINTISFHNCFVQMFLVHYLGSINAFVILLVAIDQFVAVRNPLRYCVLITNKTIFIVCSMIWTLLIPLIAIIVYHAFDEPYCNSNIITQNYCERNAVIKLSCRYIRQKGCLHFHVPCLFF